MSREKQNTPINTPTNTNLHQPCESVQVEEMIKVIEKCSCAYTPCDSECAQCSNVEMYEDNINHIARTLYEAGYRKQSDNTIELPCKVGDTVYRLKKRRGIWCILPREVVSITYRLNYLQSVEWEIFSTETDVLGKSVFLTEQEAEEALAKMKGGAE